MRRTALDVRSTLSRHWKLGSLLGLVFGVALVRNVLTEDGTPHPDGAYYVFELIWRGGVYGAVDALLLTVVPCLIVYRSLGGRLTTWRRRPVYFGVSLALVWTITAVYHLGYTQAFPSRVLLAGGDVAAPMAEVRVRRPRGRRGCRPQADCSLDARASARAIASAGFIVRRSMAGARRE